MTVKTQLEHRVLTVLLRFSLNAYRLKTYRLKTYRSLRSFLSELLLL